MSKYYFKGVLSSFYITHHVLAPKLFIKIISFFCNSRISIEQIYFPIVKLSDEVVNESTATVTK